ncbi:hypothetical protein PoB_001949800 [Plakobranchus ocellatus]|uniref:Uncharacterized protein n=1 Tax=Plakobranchus ocellatus TaxID=259542 RepID=A0AAV3ZEV8_9GAST|nr:hypothetical protein PoB_001949800 [Plakobranchus ocellatus]
MVILLVATPVPETQRRGQTLTQEPTKRDNLEKGRRPSALGEFWPFSATMWGKQTDLKPSRIALGFSTQLLR